MSWSGHNQDLFEIAKVESYNTFGGNFYLSLDVTDACTKNLM
jgi:hypothetical protein